MIKFSHSLNGKTVFVSCPENAEEEKQLDILVKEVKMICRMTKNTGLWIAAEFQAGLKKAVVTSLKEKTEVSESDISALKAKLETLFALKK